MLRYRRGSSCPRAGEWKEEALSRGFWMGAKASGEAMKLVLQALEKLESGFSCCYRKELLPPVGQRSIAQGTLLGRGSRQEAASSFFLLWPCVSLSLTPPVGTAEQLARWQAEMWLVECQLYHHKTKYRRVGLELRNKSLTHTHIHTHVKQNFYQTLFFPAWPNDSGIICIKSRTPEIKTQTFKVPLRKTAAN